MLQHRRAKEKSLAKKLSSGDKRTTSTSVAPASSSTGNGNEGNSVNDDASSLPASATASAPEASSNDPDARNLLGEDGNFDQSAARMISGGNANVDLCDDDLDLDVVGDEERESMLMEDDAAYDAMNGEHGLGLGATPSPGSTTSDLASASRVSLPASSNSSPSSSALRPLAPSPKDKSRSQLGANHQSSPVKRDEESPLGLPTVIANGDGAGPQRTSWHGSSGQTPTMMSSVLPSQDASNGTQSSDPHHGELADIRPPLNNDLRRPSLPTHLNLNGLASRAANGHHSGPPTSFRAPDNGIDNSGALNDNVGGNAMPPRPAKIAPSRIYDPTATRRFSLDRLASHPYAHLTLQANGAVYGQQGLSMYRRASAFAGSGQHFNVGYGRGTRQGHGAPFASERYQHWHQQRRQMGSEFGTIGEVRTPQAGAVELPLGNNFDFAERPHEDGQVDFMRRGSLPGDAFVVEPPQHFSTGEQESAQSHHQVFPREGHAYALSHRDYPPPENGPLPLEGFSFGTGTGNSSPGVAAATDGADDNNSNASDGGAQGSEVAASLAGYTFPQGPSTSSASTMPPPEDIAPLATTGPLGNPFGAPRFGSIASVASSSEYDFGSSSETSVSTNTSAGSGPGYMHSDTLSADAAPRRGSVFEFGGSGYNYDARRPSYTGQIADMLSNLDVHNGSNSSLSHEGAPPSLSGGVSFSQSSELAFALSHRKGSNVGGSGNPPPTGSAGHSPGSDMDASSTAYATSAGILPDGQPNLDQERIAFNPRQSFSNSSTNSSLIYPMTASASSSSSSLNVGARLTRNRHIQHSSLGLQIPADDFMCSDIDEVSGTGHYSPVSPPNTVGTGGVYGGMEFASTGSGSGSLLNVPHSQHPLSQSSVPMYAQPQSSHSQGSQGEVYMKMNDDSLSPPSMPYQGDLGHGSSENPTVHSPYYN
ncbi:hypothetical protein SCHPADRAFT_943802 [Schizopora paradoxa]|uniref:Uncharacterized protein n=1 Tax=Schizopora paradoxa TaxID=27342 RepID=A0A0H2RWP9_9AGAM|nr:hypothetical protein SCHPADRAFT_943802 [Schizopora paradoxa]